MLCVPSVVIRQLLSRVTPARVKSIGESPHEWDFEIIYPTIYTFTCAVLLFGYEKKTKLLYFASQQGKLPLKVSNDAYI